MAIDLSYLFCVSRFTTINNFSGTWQKGKKDDSILSVDSLQSIIFLEHGKQVKKITIFEHSMQTYPVSLDIFRVPGL